MFSDDDLVRWKKQFEKYSDEQGLALLARLEAAECLINCECKVLNAFHKAEHAAWLRSKGEKA